MTYPSENASCVPVIIIQSLQYLLLNYLLIFIHNILHAESDRKIQSKKLKICSRKTCTSASTCVKIFFILLCLPVFQFTWIRRVYPHTCTQTKKCCSFIALIASLHHGSSCCCVHCPTDNNALVFRSFKKMLPG